MANITFRHRGSFKNTEKLFDRITHRTFRDRLHKYGERGVRMLSENTPKRSALTANSWHYEIDDANGEVTIRWMNDNIQNGVNIAIILQYGHGTGTGGYVQGIDYVNPAMKDVFDEMAKEAWEEVIGK